MACTLWTFCTVRREVGGVPASASVGMVSGASFTRVSRAARVVATSAPSRPFVTCAS